MTFTSYKVENAVQVTWEFCRCAEQGRSAGRKCTKQGHPHGCHVEQAIVSRNALSGAETARLAERAEVSQELLTSFRVSL